MRILTPGGAALLGLAAAIPAAAGSFSIAPIRAELDRAQRTAVLTLHNDGDASVMVQASTLAWSQDRGEDRYEPTHDLITTPPVFQLAPKSDQIIRIALRRDIDPERELDYRVYFEEVPQAAPKDFNGLRMALRIGIPAFVAPARPSPLHLTWTGTWEDNGDYRLRARNEGGSHVQLIDFDVSFGGAARPAHVSASKYLLPAAEVTWTIKPPAGADRNAETRVHAASDRGDIDSPIAATHP